MFANSFFPPLFFFFNETNQNIKKINLINFKLTWKLFLSNVHRQSVTNYGFILVGSFNCNNSSRDKKGDKQKVLEDGPTTAIFSMGLCEKHSRRSNETHVQLSAEQQARNPIGNPIVSFLYIVKILWFESSQDEMSPKWNLPPLWLSRPAARTRFTISSLSLRFRLCLFVVPFLQLNASHARTNKFSVTIVNRTRHVVICIVTG